MITRDLVVVQMTDVLTKAERALADDGKIDLVRGLRREFQSTMREDLIGEVEALLDRKVVALLSDNHIDPDIALEAFVLEPAAE